MLRPAKFIDPDEVYWRENTRKFSDATGVPVRVDYLSWEDIRPQTAVVANTGAGPDIVIGFSSDPQIYASKIADMTDLANYLGAKYGGWQELAILYGTKWQTRTWISIPIGGGTGPVVYRKSWVKEAGYDSIPDDHEGFLALCQGCRRSAIRPASRLATRWATPTGSPTGCCGRTTPCWWMKKARSHSIQKKRSMP